MANPAIPRYLGQTFNDIPPGHRFTLYGAFWEADQGWQRVRNISSANLKKDFGYLTPQAAQLRNALRDRQAHVATVLGEAVWTVNARSIAPFVTGTGIEHPLENGMAFLNPYGLPYLPGSGVKGVVRRAAEELRDDVFGEGDHGWNQPAVDVLFGKETKPGDTETVRNRGALFFWDVFPQCDQLAVDIMTPHYGDYYQGNAAPHDSGQPNPILFLTVPPDSGFAFFVQCDRARLPGDWPADRWRTLLQAAFAHAFDWLGFGAKTAVGYGAMRWPEPPKTSPPKPSMPDNAQKAAPAAGSEIENDISPVARGSSGFARKMAGCGSTTTTPGSPPARWCRAFRHGSSYRLIESRKSSWPSPPLLHPPSSCSAPLAVRTNRS